MQATARMLDARSSADKQAISRHADAAQWEDLEYEVGMHSHSPGPAVKRALQCSVQRCIPLLCTVLC